VHKFRGNLERHRKSYEFKIFAEMPHGWLNDTMPGRYRQAQSEAAWAMMIDFLNRVYAGAYPPGRARSRFDSDISVDYDFKNNVRLE
jgi:carboxymethylenebutenolidase